LRGAITFRLLGCFIRKMNMNINRDDIFCHNVLAS
jgi:hypothetical protein